MIDYIFGEDNFRAFYKQIPYQERSIVWIYFLTDRKEKIFLKKWKDWLTVQEYCILNNRQILEVGLRYKGNEVNIDISKYDGVYIVKSSRGQIGHESRNTFTIGLIEGHVVHKTHWLLPELMADLSFEDSLESCYQPAVFLNVKKRKT